MYRLLGLSTALCLQWVCSGLDALARYSSILAKKMSSLSRTCVYLSNLLKGPESRRGHSSLLHLAAAAS